MKLKSFCIFLLFAIWTPTLVFGQTKKMKISVFFNNDQSLLRADGKQTIDKTMDSLSQYEISKIMLTGNTDNSADSMYNMKLSNQRTETVKRYLMAKGIKETSITTSYFGEQKPLVSNESELGKQRNRRVDIITYIQKEITKELETAPTQEVIRVDVVDKCEKDTIVTLPEGTQIVFNLCEYLEIKDCLEYSETNNTQSILANGLSLMDTSGFPIVSCGMLNIGLKQGFTNRECFKYPVKVRFPVPDNTSCDYCKTRARVWNTTSGGSWQEGQGKKNDIKIITLFGKMYYQFTMYCPNNRTNCDCKLDGKGRKMKFKTKRSYKIVQVTVSSQCPTTVIQLKPKKRKNIAKLKIPCWVGEKTVIATVIDKNGDTLILQQQPLNDLPKRTVFSRCPKYKDDPIAYRMGIFPVARREFYRKYWIKPSMLKPVETDIQ